MYRAEGEGIAAGAKKIPRSGTVTGAFDWSVRAAGFSYIETKHLKVSTSLPSLLSFSIIQQYAALSRVDAKPWG